MQIKNMTKVAISREGVVVVGIDTHRRTPPLALDASAAARASSPRMTVVGTAAFPHINHGSFSTLGLGIGAMACADAFPPRNVEECACGSRSRCHPGEIAKRLELRLYPAELAGAEANDG